MSAGICAGSQRWRRQGSLHQSSAFESVNNKEVPKDKDFCGKQRHNARRMSSHGIKTTVTMNLCRTARKNVRLTVFDSFPHGFLQFDNPLKHMEYSRLAVSDIIASMRSMMKRRRRWHINHIYASLYYDDLTYFCILVTPSMVSRML